MTERRVGRYRAKKQGAPRKHSTRLVWCPLCFCRFCICSVHTLDRVKQSVRTLTVRQIAATEANVSPDQIIADLNEVAAALEA